MSGDPRTDGRLPADASGWAAFFAGFADVVLVANSDAVDVPALEARFGDGALFVFFNKTYKVLDGPFGSVSLLVARSGPAGANIVYRREVDAVVRPFSAGGFRGILNLRVGAGEVFSRPAEFGARPVGFLDLAGLQEDIYPAGRVATSGFALALWLAEQRLPSRLALAGFSARRSARWKLFRDHDWTFEQTALRLLHRAGLLELVGADALPPPLARLTRRFPELAAADVGGTAFEVLGERLEGAEVAVDGLLSLTRWQARLDRAVRSLKPRTRKQKLAEEKTAGLAKKPGDD